MESHQASIVATVWSGDGILARIRRRVALELVPVQDGPVGPHSALAARLTAALRAKFPRLVEEACGLCSPPNGALRLQQILAHGLGFKSTHPRLEDDAGGAFLYCTPYPYDVCVVLDWPALVKWHAKGNPMAQRTPSESEGRAAAAAKPGRVPGGCGLIARRQSHTQTTRTQAPYHASLDNVAVDGGAASDEKAVAVIAPPLSFDTLGLKAFPGGAAASQLRRLLVTRLGETGPSGEGGLPPYTLPWRQLAPLVASSRAAEIQPSLAVAATFLTFVQHPASAGVFNPTRITRGTQDAQEQNPNAAANATGDRNRSARNGSGSSSSSGGYVDCVTLNVAALHRAAAAGVSAALAAAWPGTGPLQKLKRAAAHALASAPTHGAWDHTMNSGPLINLVRKREPVAYQMARGANGGLTARLDESAQGGFLLYVRIDGKEGCLRLRLDALLLEYPQNSDQGLGLGLLPAPPAAAAAPPQTALNVAASNAGQVNEDGPRAALDRSAPPAPAIPTGSKSTCPVVGTVSADMGNDDGANACSVAMPAPADAFTLPVPIPMPVPAPLIRMSDMEQLVSPADVARPRTTAGNPLSLPSEPCRTASGDANCVQQLQTPLVEPQQLAEPIVQSIRTLSEFEAMAQHCYSAGQVGLAAHAGSLAATVARAEAAALYVPAAVYGAPHASSPATVYLIDCSALSEDVAGAEAASCAALIRGLLESHGLVKVAHGCEQIASLAACCGASSVAPLFDTRVLLRAITAMLPPLPVLPPAQTLGAAAVLWAVGPLAAATMARLNAYVGSLRESLVATGLWSERPELMGALLGRHLAALREVTFGVQDWASNPSAHEAALVAAARHLPELWEAMTNEAVPWVAMAAAATAMDSALAAERQRQPSVGQVASAAQHLPASAAATTAVDKAAAAPTESAAMVGIA